MVHLDLAWIGLRLTLLLFRQGIDFNGSQKKWSNNCYTDSFLFTEMKMGFFSITNSLYSNKSDLIETE